MGYSGWVHLDYAIPIGHSLGGELYWDEEEDWDNTTHGDFWSSLDSGVVDAVLEGNIVKLGSSFSVDLDNDGVEEAVDYTGSSMIENYYEGKVTLSINGGGTDFTGDYFESDVYGVSLDGENIILIVYDMGPSDDPVSEFLGYSSDELFNLGTIYDWPGDMQVSDGVIYCKERCVVVDTAAIDVCYELHNGSLRRIDQDYYTINNYEWGSMYGQDEYYAHLVYPLYVYEEPDYNSDAYEIDPQNVRFALTDGYAWAYVDCEDGTGGWFDFSSISYEEKAELFGGLRFAD